MKFAAIDVGSNAVRLLIANVYEIGQWTPLVNKANLYRVPLRLGEEVFLGGRISAKHEADFIHTMEAFQHLMTVCGVEDYLACATSAMRNAENGMQLAERVRLKTGIDLRIIDGPKEAEYIAMNRLDGRFMDGNYLFIDVGGGSTEVGTIRIKDGLVAAGQWDLMRDWVKKHAAGIKKLEAIGSGGNINKMFKMTGKSREKPLPLKNLQRLHRHLDALSMEERMVKLRLRPDRADVIVPAGNIFINVMKWAGIKRINVPGIGLSDGMIHALYRKHRGLNGEH